MAPANAIRMQLNPPTIWNLMLNAVLPILDHRTKAKIKTIHSNPDDPSSLRAALEGLNLGISGETIEWVMATSRTKPVAGTLPPLPATAAHMRLVPEPAAADSHS